jgi:hypothetical protein
VIEQRIVPAGEDSIEGLALLLLDATAAGASVGFLDSTTIEFAKEWWRQNISSAGDRTMFLAPAMRRGLPAPFGSVLR